MIIPLIKDLAGKSLLLELPSDIRDTVLHARYLKLFQGSDVKLLVFADEDERKILSMVSSDISYLDDSTAVSVEETIRYDLAKLRFFADDSSFSFPYIKASAGIKDVVDLRIANTGKVRIGLCLDNPAKFPDLVFSVFTVHQLMNMEFYLFSENAVAVSAAMPDQTSFFAVERSEGIEMIAAWIDRMDIVIAEENLNSHIAGALGKSVWLVVSGYGDNNRTSFFEKSYPGVSVAISEDNSLFPALRKISLSLYFDFSDTFQPYSTDCASGINVDVPYIAKKEINNINEIVSVLDDLNPCLTNVAIETTTVCNLSCPYCPNSTVGRDPAFMETETYHRIIDSLAGYMPDYSGTIAPHLYGEPLVDDRIEALVGYTRARLPNAVIEIYTNGEFLTVSKFIALKSAGVDLFRISQHTEKPSEMLLSSLAYIKQHHPAIYTVEYKVFWSEPNKMNRGGLVEAETFSRETLSMVAGCSIAHRFLTFDFRGNALLCCNDYLSGHCFGNIADNSVKEIWEGLTYRRIRNQLMFGYLPYGICKACFGFQKGNK